MGISVDTKVSLNPFGLDLQDAGSASASASNNKLFIPPAAIQKFAAPVVANVPSVPGANISGLFSAPDQYEQKALDLLQPGPEGEPPSKENVAKAQQLMEAGQLIFQMISETMKEQADDAKTAIKAASE